MEYIEITFKGVTFFLGVNREYINEFAEPAKIKVTTQVNITSESLDRPSRNTVVWIEDQNA